MDLKIAIDYGIMGLLTVMSIISLAVTMERFIIYRRLDINDFKDKKSLELEITKNLNLIATIGSNAPYIGLLGTVLGIMLTFQTMGKIGFMDSTKVMSGLALALKSTAVGLLVAIPAVIFYNFLLRKAKVIIMKWEIKNG